MPPQQKVLTEDQQKELFEQWQTTEEYTQWEDCRQVLLELVKDPRGLTETTHDLTGDWYKYLGEIWKLFAILKVKNPQIKKLQQEHVRSFFFGRHDDDETIHYVDGIHSGVSKDAGQRAYHLRHKFIGVYKLVQDLPDFEPTNYIQKQKEMVGFMKEFLKFFQAHLKQQLGHVEIYDGRLFDVLLPLRNLIEKNMEYRIFVLKYQGEYEQEVVHFKLKELQQKYTQYLQQVIRIIVKESQDENHKPVDPPINVQPPVQQIFYKLHYSYEEKNQIEKIYLDPLHESFVKLQKELCRLEFKGINYWQTPLWMNFELVTCIKNLLNAEIIAKALLGNELQREQLNFVYHVLQIMKDSDEKVFENMLKEDENAINKACPLVIIFKMIQYQRRWQDTQAETERKKALEKEALGVLAEMRASEEEKSPLKQHQKQMELKNSMLITTGPPGASVTSSPSKTIPSGSPDKKGATNNSMMNSMKITQPIERLYKLETLRIPGKQLNQEEKLYGRYFLLENYIDEDHQKLIEEAVELIRHINPAVQQDIQDYYIKEGIRPTKKRGVKEDQDLKAAIQYLDDQNLLENDEPAQLLRPPEMWNYPKIVQEVHQFRTIADPKQSYIDGRIDMLNQIIEDTSRHLLIYNAVPWARLVKRIINCFRGEYAAEPELELIKEEIKNN